MKCNFDWLKAQTQLHEGALLQQLALLHGPQGIWVQNACSGRLVMNALWPGHSSL